MSPALTLPRLVFGPGKLADLSEELAYLGCTRPLLISDRGLEKAGIVARVLVSAPMIAATFLDVPENPTAAGADGAAAAYRNAQCDSVIALGGGSVIDTAKLVAALIPTGLPCAADLIGHTELIDARVIPLVAIPTTLGTGSESSPVSAMHLVPGGPTYGVRNPRLVPKLALCDPELARSLPPRLIAATGIDALSHCIEGFFARADNPVIDALALDGAGRAVRAVADAMRPEGDEARTSLMAAAYAGGVAIHKGLGPAHAVAVACADQHLHHGTAIAVALPHTTRLLAAHVPGKAAQLRAAMGLEADADLGDALATLCASVGMPATLAGAGYEVGDAEALLDAMMASHFNRSSPYAPTREDYRAILDAIAR